MIARLFKFGVVGVSNLGLELIIFNIFVIALGTHPELGKTVGAAITIFTAYIANKLWVFQHKQPSKAKVAREAFLFIVINISCLVVNVILYAALIRINFLEELFAMYAVNQVWRLNFLNIVSIGVIAVLRYALYHFWVFKAVEKTV